MYIASNRQTIIFIKVASHCGRQMYTLYTSAPIGIRTRVLGFKVPSDNHYTIGARHCLYPYVTGLHRVGFEPTRFTTAGLKSASLDHSDIGALVVMCPTHPHYNRTPYFYTLFKVYTICFVIRSSSNKQFFDLFRSVLSPSSPDFSLKPVKHHLTKG